MTQSTFPRGYRRRSSYRPRAYHSPRGRYSARRSPYRRANDSVADFYEVGYNNQTFSVQAMAYEVEEHVADIKAKGATNVGAIWSFPQFNILFDADDSALEGIFSLYPWVVHVDTGSPYSYEDFRDGVRKSHRVPRRANRRTANTREDAERYVIQTLGPHVDKFDVDGMLEDLNWELDGWDYSRFQEEDFWELAAFHDNTRTRRWDTPGGYRNRPRHGSRARDTYSRRSARRYY